MGRARARLGAIKITVYCGLGIVMRSSSDWVQTPKGACVRAEMNKTRGLSWNFNRILKQVFKGAATTVRYPIVSDAVHAVLTVVDSLADGSFIGIAGVLIGASGLRQPLHLGIPASDEHDTQWDATRHIVHASARNRNLISVPLRASAVLVA